MSYADRWTCVRVEIDAGIAWVELNRPEKRNAMNPTLNAEMVDVLLALDADDSAGVLVLTGAGDAWSAGMDLKEYFREVDGGPEHVQRKVRRDAAYWQWRLLRTYAKPTIAMVNGWCFGGAFTPLVACDLAIAADEATFGLSEINWGIPPGSVVSRALADTVGSRAGLLYVMTGRTFDGVAAAEMGLVNSSVPSPSCAAKSRRWHASCWPRTRSCCERPSSATSTRGTMSWDRPRTTSTPSSSSRSSSMPSTAASRAWGSSSTRSASSPGCRPTSAQPTPDVEPRLTYVIGRLDRILRRRISAAVEPAGLSLPAYTALSVLRAQDGLSNAHLARRSLVTPQSMNEVLSGLVEHGYVRRVAGPGQGRAIRIELTPAGSRVLESCERAVDEVEQEMLGDFDAGERASLRDALLRCGRSLERGIEERAGILRAANDKDGAA